MSEAGEDTHGDRGPSARELLAEAQSSSAPLLAALDEDQPLLEAGVDSAALVELALLIEDRLGRPLEASELDRLTTLRSIDGLLGDRPPG